MTKRIPAKQQAATAAKINAIRANARGITVEALRALPCPTCCRPAAMPYRRIVDGKITEGCVDAHHHVSETVYSCGSSEWHTRPAAAELRRAELKHLEAL